MSVTFVVYIDESGDTGLNKVKPDNPDGATEWLVLAAFLVAIQHDSKVVSWVQDVQAAFKSKRRDLHFNKLLPFKKGLVCSALAKKDAKGFVIMSNKPNIANYKNPNLGGEKSWLYWWLTRLLLERVTDYCERQTPTKQHGTDKLRIVFSRRGGLTYDNLKAYLDLLHYQSVNKILRLKAGDSRFAVWAMLATRPILAGSRITAETADQIEALSVARILPRTVADMDSSFAPTRLSIRRSSDDGQWRVHA